MISNSALRQDRCERACWWLDHGVDIVPLKPLSKHLQPGYGSSKVHITTAEFACQWFLKTNANLGIVLGGAAGVVVADWDFAPSYEAWRTGTGAAANTLTERTARGYHAFFLGLHFPSGNGNDCELKTSGVCMVAPSVHPSGAIYEVVHNAPITSISQEQAFQLFPFLGVRSLDQTPLDCETLPLQDHVKKGTETSTSLVRRIKEARSIVDELAAAGVTGWQRSGKNLVARCVFHKDTSPSLWVNPISGLWGCNAVSCPAHDGRRAHDVINARALWKGISEQEAIRQLAADLFPVTVADESLMRKETKRRRP
jgi:hypothetical protein